ncbi:MAG: Zn-ribbon domain-containing OB-fold protein [bacterium]
MRPHFHAGSARVWHGTMPVEFLYTAGAAGERFFDTLRRRDVFAVTRCQGCNLTYLPPRLYCERCFDDLSETWQEVPPVGRVHTFTVVRVDGTGRPLPTPDIVAYVRIDGTDGGMVARLLQVAADAVRLDMPVRAILAPRRRRRGVLADLLGFAPTRS